MSHISIMCSGKLHNWVPTNLTVSLQIAETLI